MSASGLGFVKGTPVNAGGKRKVDIRRRSVHAARAPEEGASDGILDVPRVTKETTTHIQASRAAVHVANEVQGCQVMLLALTTELQELQARMRSLCDATNTMLQLQQSVPLAISPGVSPHASPPHSTTPTTSPPDTAHAEDALGHAEQASMYYDQEEDAPPETAGSLDTLVLYVPDAVEAREDDDAASRGDEDDAVNVVPCTTANASKYDDEPGMTRGTVFGKRHRNARRLLASKKASLKPDESLTRRSSEDNELSAWSDYAVDANSMQPIVVDTEADDAMYAPLTV